MSKKPKRHNGLKRRSVLRARAKIVREVERKGFITNAKAKKLGKFSQAWFHLQAMADAGVLKHSGYNEWTLAKPGSGAKLTAIGPQR